MSVKAAEVSDVSARAQEAALKEIVARLDQAAHVERAEADAALAAKDYMLWARHDMNKVNFRAALNLVSRVRVL